MINQIIIQLVDILPALKTNKKLLKGGRTQPIYGWF